MKRRTTHGWWLVTCLACGPAVGGDAGDSGSTGETTDPASTGLVTATVTGSPGDTTEATTTGSGTAETGPVDPDTSSTGPACEPFGDLDCSFWSAPACVDGLDNDGDGLVDLDDPDCIGPCDEDEAQLGPGVLGDSADYCSLDCAFDGNTGHGDDGCFWNVECEPEQMPGHRCGDPGSGLCDGYPEVPEPCVLACLPQVPNGCDCFGCCAFEVEGEQVWRGVYDVPWEGCSTTTLDACPHCTPHMELCGNPCEPEACELCFGQAALPPGCDAAGCVDGLPCEGHCDCPAGEYCQTGCCLPLPTW